MNHRDLLSVDECRSIVSAYLGPDADAQLLKVDVRPLDGPRAGYMSDHLRIKLFVREGESPSRELCFFAKCLPRVEIHKEFVESTRFHVKETAFFSRLLKDMRSAQGDGGQDRWVPASYLIRDDLIVLEDLSVRNYTQFSARELMDVELCEAVLAELARFHSASIVLEERNRQSGETRTLKELYPDILEERSGSTLRSNGEHGWYQAAVRTLVKLVDHLPKYNKNENLLNAIKVKLPEVCDLMNILPHTSTKYCNVVCHADIWASNILIRYSENKEPNSIRFVDFQLVRYAPPASDVNMFLYMMTNKEFRSKHTDHLLNYYYTELANELERLGLDSLELFPVSQFKESVECFKVFGLIISSVALPMLLLPLELVHEFFKTPEKFFQFMLVDRSTEIVQYFRSNAEYRQRIIDVVEELIDSRVLVK